MKTSLDVERVRSALHVKTSLLLLLSICYGSTQSSRAVPLSKWKELSTNVKQNQQFIYQHVKNQPASGLTDKEKQIFRNDTVPGFNPTGVEIIAGQVAEPDGCQPQEQSVPIPPSSDPRVIHWPPCTKLPQCGGCCGTDILECVPTRTETSTVQVMKVIYSESGTGDFEFVGLHDVSLTKHLECDCRCRVQAHHCNPSKQDYNEQSCSCRCRNEQQATSCPSHKRWDEKECACVCPRFFVCLDDEFFSFTSCSCQLGSQGVAGTSPPSNIQAPDPCASVTCRAGYRPVNTGTSCVCRIQSRSSGIRSRSATRNRYWSRGSSDFDDLAVY